MGRNCVWGSLLPKHLIANPSLKLDFADVIVALGEVATQPFLIDCMGMDAQRDRSHRIKGYVDG